MAKDNSYKTFTDGFTIKQERAAILLARGRLSDAEIAEKVGATKGMIRAWKNDPAFKLKVLQCFDTQITNDRLRVTSEFNNLLMKINKEISKRVKEEDLLENLGMKELIHLSTTVLREVRAESQAAAKYLENAGVTPGESLIDGAAEYEDDLLDMGDDYEEKRKIEAKDSKQKRVVPIKK